MKNRLFKSIILGCLFFVVLGLGLFFFNDFFTGIMTQPNVLFSLAGYYDGAETPYSYFSPGHIVMIVLTIVLLILSAFLFYRKKHWINKVFVVSSVVVLACALGLFIFSLITGIYNLEWYLPFHICNLFFILLPVCAIFKGRVREFSKDFLVFAGISGCLFATFFMMNTLLFFPAWHIVSVLVWVHHLAIGMVGIYLVASGNYTRYRWANIALILWPLIAVAIAVNYVFGSNFIALNLFNMQAPITWFVPFLGQYVVLIALGIITFLLMMLEVAIAVVARLKRLTLQNIVEWIRDNINANVTDEEVRSKLLKLLTAEEVQFLLETPLENLCNPVFLYANLKRLGSFNRFKIIASKKQKI
ncbi:MAG: YwaF family protein [Firmicutes bacterium]|nr:YwaF family protein [Bacillota bacterium]